MKDFQPGQCKPEFLRQLVHLLSGAGAFLLFYWPCWAVLSLLASGVLLVIISHWYALRPNPLYRGGESMWRNGAVRYAMGVGLAVALLPAQFAFVGWLMLAAGDSASTVCGRAYPIYRFANHRSAGGFAGFVLTSLAATVTGYAWWHGAITGEVVARLASVCVLCGLAELFVPVLDDNYYLPLLGGVAFALMSI